MLRPRSNFSRSSSRIFRMDNLSCAIDPRPLRTKGRTIASVTPASAAAWDHLKEGPACRGIPGRHGAESGAGMRRNQGPASGGIRKRGWHVRKVIRVDRRIDPAVMHDRGKLSGSRYAPVIEATELRGVHRGNIGFCIARAL